MYKRNRPNKFIAICVEIFDDRIRPADISSLLQPAEFRRLLASTQNPARHNAFDTI